MKVSELGEFGLIDLLAGMAQSTRDSRLPSWQRLLIGIGDDAAAWQGDNSVELATVDCLVEGVHFPAGLAAWRELGWKSLAINLSDIAAMGGLPRYALVSLSLPGSTEVADVTALYTGLLELAGRYGVAIIGGNTSSAPLVVIDVTVIGRVPPGKPVLTRATARPGELVAVTGTLGGAAGGLEVLKRRLNLDPQAAALLREAFLRPQPRVAEGQLLAEEGIKTAIDISDGLLSDLGRVCAASGVGARVDAGRVPVAPAVSAAFGEDALALALSGGEDYELLFTGGPEVIDRIRVKSALPVTVVGEITEGKEVTVVESTGKPLKSLKKGWEHFITR